VGFAQIQLPLLGNPQNIAVGMICNRMRCCRRLRKGVYRFLFIATSGRSRRIQIVAGDEHITGTMKAFPDEQAMPPMSTIMTTLR